MGNQKIICSTSGTAIFLLSELYAMLINASQFDLFSIVEKFSARLDNNHGKIFSSALIVEDDEFLRRLYIFVRQP